MKTLPKVLFVATVEIHITTFHLPYLKYFNEQGYEVHVACAGNDAIPYCHVRHTVPFKRSPFKLDNVKSYFALKSIMAKNKFALIHCHTPVGGVIGRLAAASVRKRGVKVLYTAHGFQFYKGGPVKDWLIYYTVEKMMARFTDVLVTMNQEDYETAIRKKFKAGFVQKVSGVGLEAEKFQTKRSQKDINEIKKTMGVSGEDFVILCVGELNRNKNQSLLLKILKNIRSDKELRTRIKLILAGPDSLGGSLRSQAAHMGVAEDVVFLGYRRDIPKLLSVADIVVSASQREGLPFNILESMAAGKPVVATDIRGHRDLIQHGVNGFLVKQGDEGSFADAIKMLYDDAELRCAFGQAGARISRDFTLEAVMEQMKEIYDTALGMKI